MPGIRCANGGQQYMNSSRRSSIVGGNDEESAVADVAQTRELVLASTNATSVVTPEFRDTK